MKKENIENMLNNFKIVIRNDLDYLLRTQNCKDLLSYITDLQQENQKYKEVIDKLKKAIDECWYMDSENIGEQIFLKKCELKDILKEVE